MAEIKTRTSELKHQKMGTYLKDMVYGANDGLVTTFAVIAGVAGAALDPIIIVFLGLANLFADGFSMAASSFLAARSESDVFKREKEVEHWEVAHQPHFEKNEIKEILAKHGYSGADLEEMTNLVVKNKKFWIDLMMHEELGLVPVDRARPLKGASVTFAAFVITGFMPVAPFFFVQADKKAFWISSVVAGLMFFLVGALRTIFTKRFWVWSGIEMFFVGGFAASISYGVGFLIRAAIGY
ncbi:MAG: VIT1/CCC1 transporter family protein [Candidatus Niyogibacteria bacterium]|nr:MAG: VIT1/CCC1 transporter family protein [Candidatus Niyogibacteria bacterium]